MTRIISIDHIPPGQPLRIVHMHGYELALLPGESMAALVEAAEAVRDEVERCPWLGEVDEEMED